MQPTPAPGQDPQPITPTIVRVIPDKPAEELSMIDVSVAAFGLTGAIMAAALIGGIDNPLGAVAGGFLVGVLENLIGTYVVGTELKLSVALVLIVGVLVVRPAGLFGRRIVQRV